MSESIFNNLSLEKIYKDYTSGEDIYTIVSRTIAGTPFTRSVRDSDALADFILDSVVNAAPIYENGKPSFKGKTTEQMIDKFIESYLASCENKEDSLHSLCRLNFSLGVFRNDEYVHRLERGDSVTALFTEYCSQIPKDSSITEEIIINSIKESISTFNISPYFFKKFTENVTEDNVFYESVLLGRDANRLVSIIAAQAFKAAQRNLDIDSIISDIKADPNELEHIYDAANMGKLVSRKIEPAVRIVMGIVLIGILAALVAFFWEVGAKVIVGEGVKAITIGISPFEGAFTLAYLTGLVTKFNNLCDFLVEKISVYVVEYIYNKDEDTEDSLFIKQLKSFVGYTDEHTEDAEKAEVMCDENDVILE